MARTVLFKNISVGVKFEFDGSKFKRTSSQQTECGTHGTAWELNSKGQLVKEWAFNNLDLVKAL